MSIEHNPNYKAQNIDLLYHLQTQSYSDTIHETSLIVKPIPDPDPSLNSPLDPRVYAWRKAAEEKGNPLAAYETTPVDLVRETPAYPCMDVSRGTVSVEERTIQTRNGETPVFLMKPEGGKEKKPILLFYHGGAFITGCTDVVESFCKIIAEEGDILVIGADYRLSPEHYFPEGLYDCLDAFEWAKEHASEIGGDAEMMAVGGDSAGGTLAIGVTMLLEKDVKAGRIAKNPVTFQALIYPATLVDNLRLPDYRWKFSSYDVDDEDLLTMGAVLSLKAITAEMPVLYMGKEGHVMDEIAAPLCAENLSYLPKTLVTVCEFDYLRLQGEAFIRKLKRDGVNVKGILYKGMDHEYIDRMGYCPQAYDTAMEIVRSFLYEK